MRIVDIDHIAIDARDIEETLRFYRDVLGFSLERRVANGDTELCYLCAGERTRLEIFNHFHPLAIRAHEDTHAGVKHLAFRVEDIAGWNRRLEDAGVEFTLALCTLAHLGVRALLFKDPNGVVIELSESL